MTDRLFALLVTAMGRITSEIEQLLAQERQESDELKANFLHHRALGMSRALKIIRDFTQD
jgi:hypothetical protein